MKHVWGHILNKHKNMQHCNHIRIKLQKLNQFKGNSSSNYPVHGMSLVLTAELSSIEGSSYLYPLGVPRMQHGCLESDMQKEQELQHPENSEFTAPRL